MFFNRSLRKENARLSKTVQQLKLKFADIADGWHRIFDFRPGAWQAHHPYQDNDSALTNPTVFACQTLIANDIAKLPLCVQKMVEAIWQVDDAHEYAKLLKRPNSYQTRQQFIEYWLLSKLSNGNTYGLITRKGQKVVAIDILDPYKVTPLVSESGEVFYRVSEDQLTPFAEGQLVFPATEIIHDKFNCLYHPLVGTSPIYAAGTVALASTIGVKNMKSFLQNSSNPGGILSAPGSISESTAARLKKYFDDNYSGDNSGKVAVAGDGLKFEALRMSNVDAQLLEMLNWNDQKIASVYHVPGYMIGLGETPSYNNIEALTKGYYSQCLQTHIEGLEGVLDIGLDIADNNRTNVDIDALFRMDTKTLLEALEIGARAGMFAPNEGRERLNLKPVPGGKYPYMQQQNYSLESLANRKPKELDEPSSNNDSTDFELPDEEAKDALSALDMVIKAA